MSSILTVTSYSPDLFAAWNEFLSRSKNGTFLIDRKYMDYHADRFRDRSLMILDGKGDILSLLPAAIDGTVVSSHPGLTYGGFIIDHRMTMANMINVFDAAMKHFRDANISRFLYKAIPSCYHRKPSDEDLYCLFRAGARLVRQDVSSIVDLQDSLPWSKGKKHSLSKARRAGLTVSESTDVADFLDCLSEALARHGAKPVHSAAEVELLMTRFPGHIKLLSAKHGDSALAYVLAFDCGQAVHTQYMAARPAGREVGALDLIVSTMQSVFYRGMKYMSFGISTEQGGQKLNEGLISQKEMFGGRPIVCPQFEVDLELPLAARNLRS
ncbi:GNAT family N-acetyltransferase [Lichenibacterium minor]|uniref:GNAT family N-acetyltransferase n=1 Tax=Lichenibacterium minor TaxID=2316528 RepID=A0A4Q2U517_9HYPH|nr:GNAT family N-acetyltransferase [Lichenibacterium minor]RYC30017.1 GNAT family N-acetyltransferase [Lichenibacterium minor]